MFIQKTIRAFFDDYSATIHDREGVEIPADRIRREYAGIRAHLLARCQSGDVVAIRLNYDYRYLLTIYACMETGLTYLPLRTTWPSVRVEQIRALTGFNHLIEENSIDEICRTEPSNQDAFFSSTPESPLYIICTSGSTGEPKGVVIPRRAYENFLHWLDANFSCVKSEDRGLLVADFTFDMSLLDIGLFLLRRYSLYFSQFTDNVFRLAYEIDTFRISLLITVPSNVNMMLKEGVGDRVELTSLKYLLLGGSRFSYGAYRNIFDRFGKTIEAYNFYGPTEVTVYSHVKRLTGDEAEDLFQSNVSVGKTLTNVSCKLVDSENRDITRPHTSGEMLLGGVQVMKEYIGAPAKTAASLDSISGTVYYRTGDLAFFDEQGNFYITGRRDETLKRRGYRVNLLDIDSYIQKLACVQDCVTVARAHPDFDNLLITYVIPKGQVSTKQLQEAMKKTLLSYQMPDHLEIVGAFPTNNSGKVCRLTLEKRVRESSVEGLSL